MAFEFVGRALRGAAGIFTGLTDEVLVPRLDFTDLD